MKWLVPRVSHLTHFEIISAEERRDLYLDRNRYLEPEKGEVYICLYIYNYNY